jgi:hypothetical protein
MLVLQDFARELIAVPLLYIFWFGHLIFQSISQSILWALFLAVAILISLKSFAKPPRPDSAEHAPQRDNPGQVSFWAQRLHMKTPGGYYEWSLARHLGKLIVEVLAYNRRQRPGQIREKMESGDLETPTEIQAYLKVGIKGMPSSSSNRILRLFFRSRSRRKTPCSLGLDPEHVVKFLENQLEVGDDR